MAAGESKSPSKLKMELYPSPACELTREGVIEDSPHQTGIDQYRELTYQLVG